MPELPEVEVVKKSLQKNINQLTIKKISIHQKKLRYPINGVMLKKMINSKIESIQRRSKYLLLNFDNNFTILIHLGMTGKLLLVSPKYGKIKTSFYYNTYSVKAKHNHLSILFNKNIKMIYNDVRKFGFIKVAKTQNLNQISHLKFLGPEPLSIKFNKIYFQSQIKGRKKNIKDLLMDQTFLSGLGNIYSNEVLFLSKLNPKRKITTLNRRHISTIIKNIKNILRKAILSGGSSIKDFNNTFGKAGSFQQFFKVYGRNSLKCVRKNCKGTIRKVNISNRSTFFCSNCQK
tara:strand:- start:101 stop:967 length:867 start_codon:yes stop_codon:yes gene_type:complete